MVAILVLQDGRQEYKFANVPIGFVNLKKKVLLETKIIILRHNINRNIK